MSKYLVWGVALALVVLFTVTVVVVDAIWALIDGTADERPWGKGF